MKRCNILGVNINVTNMKETVNEIETNLNRVKGNYICMTNVHTTVISYEDKEYREIQNGGYMALPDGKPLCIVSKMRGYKEAERVAGADLMGEIFKLSETKGYTHFFYGSTESTIAKILLMLKKTYPLLNIVGTYSPPFRKLTEEEDKYISMLINDASPDFLWVGLGAPKQEIWMYRHRNTIKSLMIGVGAAFDYYAGNIKRAPLWVQNLSLEWLYRLIQEPKRLFKRYAVYNVKFVLYILRKNSKP